MSEFARSNILPGAGYINVIRGKETPKQKKNTQVRRKFLDAFFIIY
jgi:hypothetical protein